MLKSILLRAKNQRPGADTKATNADSNMGDLTKVHIYVKNALTLEKSMLPIWLNLVLTMYAA